MDCFSTSFDSDSPTFWQRTAIPANCRLEHLDASGPGVVEKQSVEFSAIHKRASAFWIDSFSKSILPIHQDRLYRQSTSFFQQIARAD